ncbi:flagellar hook protein FlgE [Desulfovibrio legallii]|uniref:Flagellar hook protein FlgE n=1 Tax=Desulfovibrio legallii TaxID=571438 RepID=A0A1G7MB75_9BACT|nr:flagellar hook-basal body complex protein [Desulfovibrio legallii]SDF59027.1 flagellar hook protein FlgE [Desulfovibrio legallii]
MNSALYIGATGMKGLSEGMNVITNNLANISTIGYKQQSILFSDLISTDQGGIGDWWGAQTDSYVAVGQTGKGLQVDTVRTLFNQGSFETSNTVTDLAINGKGFFQVTDGVNLYYTRAGDFRTYEDGVLRTPTGLAVNGYIYNADGTKGALQQVTLDKFGTMAAKATSSVDLRCNLGLESQNSSSETDPYFSLIGQYNANSSPPIDSSAYGYSTGVTLYGADGSTQTATIYYDAAPADGADSVVQFLIASDKTTTDGTSATTGSGLLMSGTLTFNSSGQLTDMTAFTPSAENSVDLADWQPAALSAGGLPQMTVDGQTVTVNLGISASGGWSNAPASAADVGTDPAALGGMNNAKVASNATTNYTDSSSTTSVTSQNGYAAGTLNGIDIGSDGTITGSYSNGKSMDLWQIPICRFTSEDGLRREGNNLFSATPEAGQMDMGVAGTENYGTIEAYATETSNVDMATEMVNMIITQRGFQSNSKVVTTADEMLQKAMELKRS